jgi:hypothetical protein
MPKKRCEASSNIDISCQANIKLSTAQFTDGAFTNTS